MLVNRASAGQNGHPMARRYRCDPLPAPGPFRLAGDLAHHLVQVMRIRPGAELVLFDGHGSECDAVVDAAGRQHVQGVASPARAATREPWTALEVAFAIPKGSRAEWLFEHGTEVGIRVFQPLRTARAVPFAPGRVERWRRIVAAAAGQCDRAFVPEVRDAMTLTELVQRRDLPAARFVAAAHGRPAARAGAASSLLAVGPEGGFTAAEDAELQQAEFVPVSLGALTLRTETAVLAGAVLLLAGAAG